MRALYAFVRRIDACADVDALTAARHDLWASVSPSNSVLADAAREFPIPLDAFDDLIDGRIADIRRATYASFADLETHCRRVTGSIARLSLGVLGADDLVEAAPRAEALGVAVQLTNILRDVLTDRRDNRIYLPADELDLFDCPLRLDTAGRITDPPDAWRELVRFQTRRAVLWYEQGLRLLTHLDQRGMAYVATIVGIHRRLLGRIAADPSAVLSRRISLPADEKLMITVRALLAARVHNIAPG